VNGLASSKTLLDGSNKSLYKYSPPNDVKLNVSFCDEEEEGEEEGEREEDEEGEREGEEEGRRTERTTRHARTARPCMNRSELTNISTKEPSNNKKYNS
jgi:hypothetical protein